MTHARAEAHPASRRHEQVHPHRVKFRREARLQLEALHLEPRPLEEREVVRVAADHIGVVLVERVQAALLACAG